MKVKSLLTAIVAALGLTATLPATAQQLPNSGFDEDWVKCIPWTSSGNTTEQGSNPLNWCISNTVGTGSMGQTTVGDNVTGHSGRSAVKVYNSSQVGQIIPGYLTLGTTWSTSTVRLSTPSNKDGGTFGGINFSYRPDALSFYYKKENAAEISTIVAYIWTGTYTQEDVPGEITYSLFGNPPAPKTGPMKDRDRNILGKATTKGGEISETGTRIASIETYIAAVASDWTPSTIDFVYESLQNPSSINVIFSAGDYFNDGNLKDKTALYIDDVKLIYYSRLASLSLNGSLIDGFDSNEYSYTIDCDELPTKADISAECLGNSGSGVANIVVEKLSATEAIATITVTNKNGNSEGFEDIDGKTSHTYTITFKKVPKAVLTGLTINGQNITIGSDETIDTGQPYISATKTQINATANEEEGSTVSTKMSMNNDIPEVMITVHNDDAVVTDVKYTLRFLPAKAELIGVKIGDDEPKGFDSGSKTAKFEMALPTDKDLLAPIPQTENLSGEVVIRDIVQEGNKYKIVAGNSLNKDITQDYYVEFWSYDVTITEVKMNGKVVTVNGFGSNNWTIDEPRPNDKTGFEFEFAQASGDPQWSVGELAPGDPKVQVTFTNENVDPRTVNIKFLDYIAELESITLDNNKEVKFSGKTADAGVRYSDGVKPVRGKTKPSSGTPEVNFSNVTDFDYPKITVTVTNSDAVPPVTNTYTLTYLSPSSSRISGVTIDGIEYSVDADGTTINATDRPMPLPDIKSIIPNNVITGQEQSYTFGEMDTENGTLTLSVRNGGTPDIDGKTSHDYIIQFAKPAISRPKSITVSRNDGGDMEWVEAFDPRGTATEYHLRNVMPTNDSDFKFEWFDGVELDVTIDRLNSPEDNDPQVRLTFTRKDGGIDYDGAQSHSYLLHFNQLTDIKRSLYLESISVSGTPIAGFDYKTFSYSIDTTTPEPGTISWTNYSDDSLPWDDRTTVTAAYKDNNPNLAVIIVKVARGEGSDYSDDQNHFSREYTLNFLPYYSRLQSITANSQTIETLNLTNRNIKFNGQMPAENEIELTAPDKTAGQLIKSIVLAVDDAVATVTVSNEKEDVDGLKEHSYTLQFDKPYFSRLASLSISGTPVEGFDRNKYSYTIAGQMPADAKVEPSYITGGSGTPNFNKIDSDAEKALVTVTLSNTQPDVDGLSSHTYTVQYDLPYFSRLESLSVDGAPVDGLTHDGATFTVACQLPANEEAVKALIDYTFKSGSGTPSAELRIDRTNALVTITVSNGGNADIDGKTSHIYNIKFDKPYLALLRAAKVSGMLISGFSSEQTDYTINGQMPDASRFRFEALTDCSGTPVVSDPTVDLEGATISVTVSNDGDGNPDYACETTYTFRYDLPYFSRLDYLRIDGKEVTLNHDGTPIVFGGQMPGRDADFEARSKQGSGEPVVNGPEIDERNYTWTFTVINSGNDPTLGGNRRTYIIQFDTPYFSTASSIKVNGNDIPDFDPAVKEYTLSGEMPDENAVEVTGMTGGNGSVTIAKSSDAESSTITVTVTNPGDGNGNYASSTVYVLHFDLPYFSRLEELSVKGAPVAGFDKDVFDYTIAGAMPAASEITATPMKASGTPNARISADSKTGIVTITVTNGGRADLDGKTEHVYTLHFDAPVNSRLASISIGGTPLAGFDPDTYSYNLTDITMPAEGEVKATAGSDKATVTISYDTENSTVTVKVSATAPDEDGLSEHTYTLRFKKSTEIPPAGGTTSVYEGTLTIMMMGEDITGGGQEAKVEITEENDGVCTFLLPNFSLDLGDGPSPLGDIKVENVSMTPDGNGGYTYSGVVKGLELAEGEIVADVTLSGTTDADGNAHMTIAVLWEGIAIDVEFNGKRTSTILPPTPPTDEEWSDYDGTLSIEMGGSYIAENQPATVFITDATDGKCTFKLPEFSLDMEGTVLNLGDITVEDVTVSESADGTTNYTGFVSAMSFLGGEIIADINLTGTVDAAGNARMTIQVLWKQDGGEDIPINVEFNGKRNEIAWISYPGKLTIALEGYDITEGGKEATIKIAQTGDEGRYSFLLPDFSIALDAASQPAMIGDIRVDELTLTPMEGFDRYTGLTEKMSLAQGDIIADVKIDGTIATNGDVRVNVDVVWIMEDGKRVPILVKFTNVDEKPVTPERIAYSGVLKTSASDGSGEREHNVTIYLSPSYGNRADMTIEGIDFPAVSRAAAIGRTVTVPGVALTTIANGMTSYDGAVSGIKYRDDMTLDITLHGFSNADNRFNLLLDINWIEEGLRLTGTFDGAEDTSAIDRIDDFTPESGDARTEYYDLRGVRVNPDNLRPGIYIRRSGNKTEKILIQ